jgi:hypothetical protein
MRKQIILNDEKFHKDLLQIKAKHGFTSIEAMLKGMLIIYKAHKKELLERRKNGN